MSETNPTADRAAPAASPVKSALRRLLTQPAFVAAVLVLGVAAVGLNAAVGYMRLHFKKQPVALRKELAMLPSSLGPWKQVSQDEALEHEIQDVLGTEKYIFRDYVDEREVGPDAIESFKDKSKSERNALLAQLRAAHPKAVVNLAVTYYTGMVDTVAHVPDRCYVASGYEPRPGENRFEKWPIKGASAEPIEVRFINFDDQGGGGSPTRSVAYVFHVNGHYEASPIGVRTSLANLLEKHGYYAKVETMTLLKDSAVSANVMTDLLSYAIPEIEKLLPDWDAVQRGQTAGAAVASIEKR
jgi:hypothetical protein